MKGTRKNKDLNVAELENVLTDCGEAYQLIDVREFPEYSAERIPGAELISLGELEERHIEIDRTKPTLLVCRSGNRAGKAKEKLQKWGFSDVRNVSGGMNAWKSAGFVTEKDENAVWDLERQVRFVAGTFVLIGVVLSLFVSQYFILLSGFIGAGLVFSALTNTCGMGMMLARMPWNRVKSNVCTTVTQKI